MDRILVALSGGVDSAAACALLRQMGYSVGGGTMLLRPGGEAEAEDAASAARQLGIPFHLFRWQEEFYRSVIMPFREDYAAGRTPNPCVVCNRTMKFGRFLEAALQLGYDGIATGHYAVVEHDIASGRYLLRTGADRNKDQTYMLYGLSQDQLAHTLFPLGSHTKAEARAAAEAAELSLARKHDSQDICFVPDGDYMAYLLADGLTPQQGRFRHVDGRDLGPHQGLEAYTLGQRRGLGLACGERVYVVGKQGTDVLIGPEQALFARKVWVENVNLIAVEQLTGARRVQARLRYTPTLADCVAEPTQNGVLLTFDRPQRAPTPGQAAVFYEGEYVLGGGTIVKSAP